MPIVSTTRVRSVALLAAALPLAASAASAASAPTHLRGTISHVSPSGIDVATATGTVHVTTTKTTYAIVRPGAQSDIKPNTFVGIASDGEAPGARAREVVVFPDTMRGTGEGHYGWDLPSGGSAMTNGTVRPHSAMTNGTVHAGSAMTNGTASSASGANGGLVLNVAYKGGSNRIVVPASAPVVVASPGTRSALHVGTHVFVIDANGNAAAIIAGAGSTVPPM